MLLLLLIVLLISFLLGLFKLECLWLIILKTFVY